MTLLLNCMVDHSRNFFENSIFRDQLTLDQDFKITQKLLLKKLNFGSYSCMITPTDGDDDGTKPTCVGFIGTTRSGGDDHFAFL